MQKTQIPKPIEKDGKIFHMLRQLDFSNDPWFALGEREFGTGALMTEMYDDVTKKATPNCLISFTKHGITVTPSNAEPFKLDLKSRRYWFTNTNRD